MTTQTPTEAHPDGACIPNNIRLTPARDASYRHLSLLKRSEMSTVKCREHRGCSVECEFQINNTNTAFLHIKCAILSLIISAR